MEILWDSEKLKKAEEHGSLLAQLAKLHYADIYQKTIKCYCDLMELDRRMYPHGYPQERVKG